MTRANRWLLPDGIEEILPPQAQRVEQLRRHLIDLLDSWGYDFIMPPVLEYLDSLLTGPGRNLDLRTFKVTDQLSGRLMGLSADTTPQVARIDAHSLAPEGVSRLCYCRTVYHTKATSLLASRTPTQIGAELYGVAGLEADAEIISLMLGMLEAAGVKQAHLDLNHVGVFTALAQQAQLTEEQQQELYQLLQLKCASDIEAWAQQELQEPALIQAFVQLSRLQGQAQSITQALQQLAQLVPSTAAAIQDLLDVVTALSKRFPSTPINIDLSELRGYSYHSGLVFAAYIPGFGDAVAKGGRYNEAGAAFGRARPATGFSADLKVLARFGNFTAPQKIIVSAPQDTCLSLWEKIRELRAQGYRVEVALDSQATAAASHKLEKINDQWQLVNA